MLLPRFISLDEVPGRSYLGHVAVARLSRFGAAVGGGADSAVWLQFAAQRDRSGFLLLRGSFRLTVELACQRCLEPMSLELAEDFLWCVVTDEAADCTDIDPSWEPVVAADRRLDIWQALEDSLLLALPLRCHHPEGSDCQLPEGYRLAKPREHPPSWRPFAALSGYNRDS